MRVGIFVSCVGRNAGGPETYERDLVEHIGSLDPGNEYHVYCYDRAADILRGFSNVEVHCLRPHNRVIGLSVSLPAALASDGMDLYHATFVGAPFSSTPLVHTMHDISPFSHPHFYPWTIRARLQPLLARGLRQARYIICISEHSRQTTAELFDIPLERMATVHIGINPAIQRVERDRAREYVREHFGIEGPYILYLGKLEARKNIVRLLEAYARLRRETQCEARLVLAGRRFWDLDGIDETIERLSLHRQVVETGYVPDEAKSPLYSAAELFVFPSLWEGFGIPVLEAMACGTPVVTSSVSALPEIAGTAAKLVNPDSVDSIAEGMDAVLSSPSESKRMISEGIVRASAFNVERMVRETAAAYRRAAELN